MGCHRRGSGYYRMVNYCWPSPAQQSWFRDRSGHMTVYLIFPILLRVLKWCLLFDVRRGLTNTGHYPSTEWLLSKSNLCYGRRSVGQSILVSSTHLGPKTRFLLLSDICGFVDVGSPLTRGRVCRLQLLLVLASAVILGSVSRRGTHDHILLSQIRDSPNLECRVPVFISSRNRVAWL
jgi:hypothetical protein